MKIKCSTNKVFLILFLTAVFLFSANTGFLFFIDSKTYVNGLPHAPVLDQIARLHPLSTAIFSIINLTIIARIAFRHGYNVFVLFLLFPYNLLLLTNLTKESILFTSMYLIFYQGRNRQLVKGWVRLAIGAVEALPRPVYLMLFLGRLSPIWLVLMAVSALLIIALQGSPVILQMAVERLEGRQYVEHVGRDFFVGLCVAEKATLFSFSKCWMPVFFGFPLHSDTLSLRAVPYYAFQIPFIYVVYKLVLSRSPKMHSLAVLAVFAHFIFFIISPTFGAFIRYTHPVVWAMGFSLLSASPRRVGKFVLRSSSKRSPFLLSDASTQR